MIILRKIICSADYVAGSGELRALQKSNSLFTHEDFLKSLAKNHLVPILADFPPIKNAESGLKEILPAGEKIFIQTHPDDIAIHAGNTAYLAAHIYKIRHNSTDAKNKAALLTVLPDEEGIADYFALQHYTRRNEILSLKEYSIILEKKLIDLTWNLAEKTHTGKDPVTQEELVKAREQIYRLNPELKTAPETVRYIYTETNNFHEVKEFENTLLYFKQKIRDVEALIGAITLGFHSSTGGERPLRQEDDPARTVYDLEIHWPVTKPVYFSHTKKLRSYYSEFKQPTARDIQKINDFVAKHPAGAYFMVIPTSNHPHHRTATQLFLDALAEQSKRTGQKPLIFFYSSKQEKIEQEIKDNLVIYYSADSIERNGYIITSANQSQDLRHNQAGYYAQMAKELAAYVAAQNPDENYQYAEGFYAATFDFPNP
ncbi:hypothetical protein NO1_1704 [Candidatus Termititenax aidoneus]|uniref:Uncharacterized protein n=1 Tax=Termititenax aidoneus TaxID=2218524 RepID=A0A388TDC6_TERA1|nr:hypothetical protein NO1_1704 [Candidatus Termititenax aidoneus]